MDSSSHINCHRVSLTRHTALAFVILLGVVSLFADMTYEGARSITGPYLAMLGASATVVGIVAGFGELVGYGLRLAAGYLSDRTGHYWTITLVGYVVNLLAVPLLALAGRWEIAAALMIAERVGKAIRTPARDAMLSHATTEMGRGWGFGLHEALDQTGAVLGPLLAAAVLFARDGYRAAFGVLLIPALLALGVLMLARMRYPNPRDFEIGTPPLGTRSFPRVFWLYLGAVGLIAAGYVDFPLIAYHAHKTSLAPEAWIPVLYAVAMGVDALAALVAGWLFDRLGLVVLSGVVLVSSLFAPLVFLGNFGVALVGMGLWGIGMGAQESIMRAAVAAMVPAERRGTAYGVFNTGYGLLWFAGSALMGVLYDMALPALIAFSVVTQLIAVALLFLVSRRREAS
ncbi:MAG TPA: MFS transporter [Candidatus Tectomicrobia bacterium]